VTCSLKGRAGSGKKKRSHEGQRRAVRPRWCEVSHGRTAGQRRRGVPQGPIALDPKDTYLLALAEASQAEFLVTGDKELLSKAAQIHPDYYSRRDDRASEGG
jgi:hypothetical protein